MPRLISWMFASLLLAAVSANYLIDTSIKDISTQYGPVQKINDDTYLVIVPEHSAPLTV